MHNALSKLRNNYTKRIERQCRKKSSRLAPFSTFFEIKNDDHFGSERAFFALMERLAALSSTSGNHRPIVMTVILDALVRIVLNGVHRRTIVMKVRFT